MESCEVQILTVRNDKVKILRNKILRLLNDLYEEFDFNQAELLIAFNEVMMTQNETNNYLKSMR